MKYIKFFAKAHSNVSAMSAAEKTADIVQPDARYIAADDPRPIVLGNVDLKPLLVAAVIVLGIISFLTIAVIETAKSFRAPPNASAPFHVASETEAARECLKRGYRYVRPVYPDSDVCLRERDGGPNVMDANAWLDAVAPDQGGRP